MFIVNINQLIFNQSCLPEKKGISLISIPTYCTEFVILSLIIKWRHKKSLYLWKKWMIQAFLIHLLKETDYYPVLSQGFRYEILDLR